jgi:YfiH family protein
MLTAPNLAQFDWLTHGFGGRDSLYPPGVTTLHQIHSGIVLEALKPGADRFADGDALVSQTAGTLVGVRTADCVPILIADGHTHAVAAIHAGWRGTAANITAQAVRTMVRLYGSRTEDLHAAIGPAIGGCCYEVGLDVARQLGIQANGPVKIDLANINETQLKAAGVTDIWQSGQCTFCMPEHWYSFRREKEAAGRMMAFIGAGIGRF